MDVREQIHFLDPISVITQAGISTGETVVDFGCAAGYFSLPCAAAVGEEGQVIAIDVLPQVLETVKSKARTEGLHNITVRQANIEKAQGSKVDSNSVDWVILKNVLFMNDDHAVILQEAKRILVDKGRILVVEWNEEKRDIGPALDLRITQKDMRVLADTEGFAYESSLLAGDYHYSIVFRKDIK